MERYLSAAWKISRAAPIGDPSIDADGETYRVPPRRSQTDHVEGLPFGTRGGARRATTSPSTASTSSSRSCWRNTVGRRSRHGDAARPRDQHRRRARRSSSLRRRRRGCRTQMFPRPDADAIDNASKCALPVHGRPARRRRHVPEEELRDAPEVLQPFQRENTTRAWTVGIPALDHVVIDGPFDVDGRAATRRAASASSLLPRGPTGARPAPSRSWRRSRAAPFAGRSTDEDASRCSRFYERGAQGPAASRPASRSRSQRARRPAVPLPRRAGPADTARPEQRYRISDLELASRLSFFLWSSIPDDELLDAGASRVSCTTRAVLEQQVRRMLADPRAGSAHAEFRRPVAVPAQPGGVSPDPSCSRISTTTCGRRFSARPSSCSRA